MSSFNVPNCLLTALLAQGVAGSGSPLPGQEPRSATLKPATSRLAEDFSRIAGIRELSDGRVLVADAGDQRLVAELPFIKSQPFRDVIAIGIVLVSACTAEVKHERQMSAEFRRPSISPERLSSTLVSIWRLRSGKSNDA